MTEELNTAVESAEQATPETNTAVESTAEETTTWLDSIQDAELRDSKSLANFKDIEGLAKSYVHLEKKLGAAATEEPVEYKAEDYSYEVPEGYESNQDLVDPLKEIALENGIKPESFKALAEAYIAKESELMQQAQQAQEAEFAKVKESLSKEWGSAYEDNLKKAEETWQFLTDEQDDKLLDKLDTDTKLALARAMHKFGEKISEPKTGKMAGSTVLTKEQAQSKLNDIYANDDHPYFKNDPSAVAEVFELQKAISADSL
jgi:hypothetical protein